MFASTFVLSTRLVTKKFMAAFVGTMVALVVVVGSVAYEVRPGDTLGAIASAHGVTLDQLLAVNDVADPDLIHPGDQIVIPGGGSDGGDVVHVVESGETLDQIAAEYSTDTSAIASLNELQDRNLIRVGQKLLIPTGATGSTPDAQKYHVVEAGETLASIAGIYGIDPDQIAEANGITNPALIYVGTRLALSGKAFVADPEPETSDGETHTVAAGQTLGSIARSYGISVEALAAANDISNVDTIRAGSRLTIPAGGESDGGATAWVCPVAGAEYVNDWGFPRNGGRFHQGNDLFAPRGTEVKAPVGGQIQLITGDVGGLQFYLHGDDGVTYIGTHLDGFGRAGQVEAGHVIGYVGDSGNARGSSTHLHFEMHPGDGAAVNPYPTLRQHGC